MSTDPAHRALELLAGLSGQSEHAVALGRLRHLRIRIGRAKAEEVQSPHVEASRAEFVAPGTAIETMRDRQRRWERAAVNIQYDLRHIALAVPWRQMAQE